MMDEEHTETMKNNTAEGMISISETEKKEESDNAGDERNDLAILEGLLYIVGDDGLTALQAASVLSLSEEKVKNLLQELIEMHNDASRGVELREFGGIYRFFSKPIVSIYAQKLFQIEKHATLSQAALETLAIIAYKQPITRVEIEEIRGVGADMMLRKLLARDLIRESGRSQAPGKPILYEVTDEFMNSFKLMSLKELPELPTFNSSEDNGDGDFLKE